MRSLYKTIKRNMSNESCKHGSMNFFEKTSLGNFPRDNFTVRRSDTFQSHETYGNLEMKTFMFDKERGVRQLCNFKKGHVEYPHYHTGVYEWFVLSGKFLVKNPVNGDERIVQAGDYYYNPAYIPHTETCLEDGTVLWIYNGRVDYNTLETL